MIEDYRFGSITIAGQRYRADLKIINGRVVPDWWRRTGHVVDVDDVADILAVQPEYLVIGSGSSGLMKVAPGLENRLAADGIKSVVAPTGRAAEEFNAMLEAGQSVAACFHLTC